MTISFHAEDIELPAIKKEAVSNWIKAVTETYGKKTGDITYIFCSDEKILEVNRQYLQQNIGRPFYQPGYGKNKFGKVRNTLQRRTASHNHPRNSSSMRHQR